MATKLKTYRRWTSGFSGSTLSFNDSVAFKDNNALYGGGIGVQRNNLRFTGIITFTDNSASEGGGMRIFDAYVSCDGYLLQYSGILWGCGND